ncbi:hypothetical protein CMUS01_09399 [Colletotrichum musicola]|uniref:Uncharacterized protein n=1 Tax=Colletotrichum musicola TaxID=2175873 RepID=A0A8H6NAT4_9PEZI|nr:hypothetical protein CMUS01_09399 [Colletotrichum musicola]
MLDEGGKPFLAEAASESSSSSPPAPPCEGAGCGAAGGVRMLAGPSGCCMYPSSASAAGEAGERCGKRLRTEAAPGRVATPPSRSRADDEDLIAPMVTRSRRGYLYTLDRVVEAAQARTSPHLTAPHHSPSSIHGRPFLESGQPRDIPSTARRVPAWRNRANGGPPRRGRRGTHRVDGNGGGGTCIRAQAGIQWATGKIAIPHGGSSMSGSHSYMGQPPGERGVSQPPLRLA